jgi:hypothetical protein
MTSANDAADKKFTAFLHKNSKLIEVIHENADELAIAYHAAHMGDDPQSEFKIGGAGWELVVGPRTRWSFPDCQDIDK